MPKIEKIDKEESIDGEVVETQWDIKRIGIALFILALLIIAGSYILFPAKSEEARRAETLGVSVSNGNSEDVPELPTKADVENIINEAQDTLSEITSENLTSSQAAIQKLITDLEKLKEDKGAAGVICDLVCKKD